MSTPYECERMIDVDDPSVAYGVDFPGRCTLARAVAVKVDGDSGAADFTIYNRAFTSDQFPIAHIEGNDAGGFSVTVYGSLPVRVGDRVVVAGTTGFDGDYRVQTVSDDYTLNTRTLEVTQILSGVETSLDPDTIDPENNHGTVELSIPESEQVLYEVDAASGVGTAEVLPDTPFVNQDVLANRNFGVNRRLYLKFAANGRFKVALRAKEGIGVGGA